MKKTVISLVAMVALVGCGGGDTYEAQAPLYPDQPSDGSSILVTADNGSSAGVSYTDVGDGSILVNCGDNCTVYTATPLDGEDGAGTTTSPTPVPQPN